MPNTLQRILAVTTVTLGLLVVPVASAAPRTSPQDAAAAPSTMQQLVSGKRYKIRGVVVRRDGDGFVLKDTKLVETGVLLTNTSKVQIDGKPVTEAQRYELRKLVGGIVAEVQGRGDASGKLVAEKISVSSKEMRAALAMANTVDPVAARVTANEAKIKEAEAANAKLSGQVDELNALSNMAMEEAQKANARVSALDDYAILETSTVTFAVNSAVLSAQSKKDLDAIAAKSEGVKAFAFEITGYTDTSGNAEKNRILSEKRANAVVRYLADTHKIPLRRIVTPLGYGAAKAAADNTTPEGRQQNRRVEVRLMQQGGIAQ